VLVNLLSNAVKFTPDDGRIGIDATADRKAGLLTFTVWDTGMGIAEEDIKQVLRPFVQIDSGLNRNSEGTGLGLAVVAKLVELHRGVIRIDSALGEGSRFHVSIPWHG
ncbi:MAG: hypothetical protein KDD84_13370, partial [Caldilineaceae bacterium]|nr:hypothetical protein [Caldilineaceae bacterium]